MKNHFFIGYYGNKRQEVEKIYDEIKNNLENKEFIIEPYCGSSALSYYIWLNNKDKNYKYILNDNNKFIIELYKISKDENKFDKFIEDLKTMFNECKNKEDYNKIFKNSKDDLLSYIYVNRIYSIRPGLYPIRIFKPECFNSIKNAPIIDFVRNANIEFLNIDGIELYEKYKDNDKAFLFLDPPYMNSNNSFYKNPSLLIYEHLFINDINKNKAYITLCLENNWIIKLLFKDKKNILYDKKYETTKKSTTHILILNK